METMTRTGTRDQRPPSPPLEQLVEPSPTQKIERVLTLVITIVPFLGFIAAIVLLWGRGIAGLDVALLVALYSITCLGVTIGFHRMLTHRGFDAPAPVRVALAIAGSLAVQGSVIRWVADHRRHHAFTDREGDPHSPHLEEARGVKGVFLGLWHSHMGWFFDNEKTRIERFAADLLKDRPVRVVSALFPLWIVLSFAVAPLIALAITGSLQSAFSALVWGSLVRIFLLHHVTWSINSICHFFGKRPFESGDLSTNNWVMALLSFGEGWHNNHHAFPRSAIHGLGRWQLDVSGLIIRFMAKLRLVRNVKVPTPRQIALKRA